MRADGKRWLMATALVVLLVGCGMGASPTKASKALTGGQLRSYFIAADPVEWDYAPSGKNLITGEAFGDHENTFVARGNDRIGHVYQKSLYREYTDGAFKQLKPRPAAWEHLGMLGPVIHAEVGDEIEVTFQNNTPFPASIHPHGVLYGKDSEGSPYADDTTGSDKADDQVPTGRAHVYHWSVPERSGPGPDGPSSVMWMYHSHTDEVGDMYSGLIGPIIVTRRGEARADGSPKDVDREFVANLMVEDENSSPWIGRNIENYAGSPQSVNPDDDGFHESNLMHSINGYVYGNLPGLDMEKGQHVRWYLMGMGTEVDLHTPHWHGNVVDAMGMGRTDVVSLLPASMVIADMTPDNPGTWLFHCHVSDHIVAGMQALYHVK
jgi:hephaestin